MFELADRLVGIYKTDNCTKSVTLIPHLLEETTAPPSQPNLTVIQPSPAKTLEPHHLQTVSPRASTPVSLPSQPAQAVVAGISGQNSPTTIPALRVQVKTDLLSSVLTSLNQTNLAGP